MDTGVASDGDRVGITLAHAGFSPGYRRTAATQAVRVATAENVVEVTYRRALGAWLTVQPDLQYVVNPSGGPTRHDALAVGLRVDYPEAVANSILFGLGVTKGDALARSQQALPLLASIREN